MTVLANTIFTGSPSGTDVGLTQVADLTASANVLGNTTFGIDASAGAVRATLPPATGSGDRIVITADDATNTVEIASGDSLNGEALGSIFPALNDVVYLIDAKVGDWTGRVLQAPAVTPVDEFNSNAVVTSTVGTLSFAAGDLTFTDPLNVETWFAGPAVDATAVGGSATQYAFILDDNYTLLAISGPTAITDSPYILWFSGLNAGDTIEAADPAFSDISAVGAGTLTGADQVTADGTGFVGIQVTGVGGLTLTLSGGTMHMFGEIPLPTAAGSVTPVDVETVEFAKQTGLGFGPAYSLDSSRTWNQLKSDYQYLRCNLEIDVTGVPDDVLRSIIIKTADIRDDTRWRFEYGSGVVDLQPGVMTGGDFTFDGSTTDEIAMEIVGVKAQQQILPANAEPLPTADGVYELTITAGTPTWTAAAGGGGLAHAYGVEIPTGDTFNGAPVFSQAFDLASLTNGSQMIASGIVAQLLNEWGRVSTGGTTWPAPIATSSGAQFNTNWFGSGTAVNLQRGGAFSTAQAGDFLVLEYTKV